MTDKSCWNITGIIFIILVVVELVLWSKFKKNYIKNNKKSDIGKTIYIYALCEVGIIVSIIFILSSIYLSITRISFPKAEGISRDTWVGFWGSIIGCTIGGIIGGIVAFRIMKYQLDNQKEQAEKDREERIKLDLQVDVYKQLVPLLNDYMYNIFKQKMNLQLFIIGIKNSVDFIKTVKDYEKQMQEDTEINRKLGDLNLNFRRIISDSLNEQIVKVSREFMKYNTIIKRLYSNLNNIIRYSKSTENSIKNGHKEFISNLYNIINKDIIVVYNENLVEHMNNLYYLLSEYSVYAQNELLPKNIGKIIDVPKNNKTFQKLEYLDLSKDL